MGSLLGVAVLCALIVIPARAFAATASIDIKRVYYIAGAGEANELSISLSGTSYQLSDPRATIAAGSGCSASDHTATCSGTDIIGITVNVGDSADSVRIDESISTPATLSGGNGTDSLQGGSGNDVLRGNQGVDYHYGEAGDDFIDSRGSSPDFVNCGSGNDTARADSVDVVAADCEIVDRDAAVPGGSRPSPAAAGLLGPKETAALEPGACARELLGTSDDDRLNGTSFGDSLFGQQGNDTLAGLGGDDCVFGGVGSDRLAGDDGDDRLLGDDSKRGIAGNDRLRGGRGNDFLSGGPGKDSLRGNDGNDRLSGGSGSDRLAGGRGRNRLFGGSGNDSLNAVNGRRDKLYCGRGRDRARADRADFVRGCERVRRVR